MFEQLQKLKNRLKPVWDKTVTINARLSSRVERWSALYAAGGGTASEYLTADFNTDCPVGLDTQPWADQKTIKLQSLLKSESHKNANWFEKIMNLRWGGWVEGERDDIIHLNPLRYSLPILKLHSVIHALKDTVPITLADVIPHEFIHTRQHYSNRSGWPRNNAYNDIEYVGLNEISKFRQLWRKTVRFGHDKLTATRTKAATTSRYFARSIEMQARMHEMIACGYCQWQRLPTTRIELWAALSNMGLKTPNVILQEIKGTQAGQKALEDFSLSPAIKSLVSGKAYELNLVYDYAGEADVQKALWTAKYPLLYGELLEFYGDRIGRERMGMGTNPRPAIEVLYNLKTHADPITQQKSRELAGLIPPPVATAFLNCIIENYPKDSDHFDNAMRISKELLARGDVKTVLFADNYKSRIYTGQNEVPPLMTALRTGHIEMTGILMDAGADPFQQYSIIDMREKILHTSYPASVAFLIDHDEEKLANPDALPKEDRKLFNNPEYKNWLGELIKARRAAIQEMINRTDDPENTVMRYKFNDSSGEISLSQLLSRIGIVKSSETKKSEMSPEAV